jgi:hypothetical protein
VELFASQRGSFEGQLKHKYKRKADYARHCGTSDHDLAAIIIKAPGDEDERRPLNRRLRPHEEVWSSVLSELSGYRDAYLTLRRRRNMLSRIIGIVGDSLCCHYIFEKGGSQVVDDANSKLLITEALLELLSAVESFGAEVRFRWVRREYVLRCGRPEQVRRPHGLRFAPRLAGVHIHRVLPMGRGPVCGRPQHNGQDLQLAL